MPLDGYLKAIYDGAHLQWNGRQHRGVRRMALWLVRAGSNGEHEQRFLQSNRIYLTWQKFNRDLSKVKGKQELRRLLQERQPNDPKMTLMNYSGQIWAFTREIQLGDWIVLPLKTKPSIAFGEIMGSYEYDPAAEDPYFHSHSVKWLASNVPRSLFDQDLLFSFGAFMTICRIERNDAENRVRAMAKAGWKAGDAEQKVDRTGDVCWHSRKL